MDAVKMTLYDVEWQALRVSLLGGWFSVGTGRVDANIAKLEEYYQAKPSLSRAHRINNLLAAVLMGYSGQKVSATEVRKVKEAQTRFSTLTKKHSFSEEYDVPNQDQIRKDWKGLEPAIQSKIIENLSGRLDKHITSTHRTELRWFLQTIGVLNDQGIYTNRGSKGKNSV